MNEYLTACTEVLLAQGGALDKYIGDAVGAIYGGLVKLEDHLRDAKQVIHPTITVGPL